MEIRIEDDFDPERIAESGQCFRWVKGEDGAYRIIHGERCLFLRARENGVLELSCPEEEYRAVWYDYFDFGVDYRAVRARVNEAEDPFLAEACEFGKGIRILRQDPWEALVSFVISQNKNIPAIKRSVEMLCEAAGRRAEPGVYLFPTPEEVLSLSDETLAGCRLGYRCRYVRAAALEVAEGRLDLERLKSAPEEETMAALTGVFGVGVKVASCVSLFGLHHTDAFPVDVWVRRILENEYPAGYPMEKYRPYNGIYQQYMFYYYREKYGK